MYSLEPEYPSLTEIDLREVAATRLAKSQRKFLAERRELIRGLTALPVTDPWMKAIIGDIADHTRSNSSGMDAWMRAWRMPPTPSSRPDVTSSLAIFVGLEESSEMPDSSPVSQSSPYVSITTKFIRDCSRISQIFPFFAALVANDSSLDRMSAARNVFFDLLDPAAQPNPGLADFMRNNSDVLFTQRTTAAAVRWAIAHEMAHLVVGKNDRQAAYDRVAGLYPDMEAKQWEPKRESLDNYRASRDRYRDEIACDLLAIDFILASPFATDDLITQVSGSLLALEAIKWDGWFKDKSALSPTHPSPALRFEIVKLAWMEKLSDPETWKNRNSPGTLGVEDIAHWAAFERWSAGAYREGRDGMMWAHDIQTVRENLLEGIPELMGDQVYVHTGEDTFQVRQGR